MQQASLRDQPIQYTLPKFNIAPEKWCLEDDSFLLGLYIFSGELLNFQGAPWILARGFHHCSTDQKGIDMWLS